METPNEANLTVHMFQLEHKMDRVIELLEDQKRRAKWAIFWKLFWIFVLVIFPMYLSYKFFANFDLKGLSDGLKAINNTGLNGAAQQFLMKNL
jgi:hypothetical protein